MQEKFLTFRVLSKYLNFIYALLCFLKTWDTFFAVKSDTTAEIFQEFFLVSGLKVQL